LGHQARTIAPGGRSRTSSISTGQQAPSASPYYYDMNATFMSLAEAHGLSGAVRKSGPDGIRSISDTIRPTAHSAARGPQPPSLDSRQADRPTGSSAAPHLALAVICDRPSLDFSDQNYRK
jgi:hypothetical protein